MKSKKALKREKEGLNNAKNPIMKFVARNLGTLDKEKVILGNA